MFGDAFTAEMLATFGTTSCGLSEFMIGTTLIDKILHGSLAPWKVPLHHGGGLHGRKHRILASKPPHRNESGKTNYKRANDREDVDACQPREMEGRYRGGHLDPLPLIIHDPRGLHSVFYSKNHVIDIAHNSGKTDVAQCPPGHPPKCAFHIAVVLSYQCDNYAHRHPHTNYYTQKGEGDMIVKKNRWQ